MVWNCYLSIPAVPTGYLLKDRKKGEISQLRLTQNTVSATDKAQ
jgi:hypothetical protein